MQKQLFLFDLILFLATAALIYNNVVLRQSLALNQFAQTNIIYSGTGRPDQAIVNEIQNAKQYVYFAVYTLTKENIAAALIAAKMRGLDVRGVLDYNQSIITQEKPWISKFKKYGINLEIPVKQDGLMHIKMLVTDQSYGVGSFNWTTSGTFYNDEILEIGKIESLREKYLKIFQELWKKYGATAVAK